MYERFEQLLKENNTTAYQVSKKTGVATATLSDWKNGRSVPKQDKLAKIADYFNVSLDYLIGRTNKPKEYLITSKDEMPDVLSSITNKILFTSQENNQTAEERKQIIEQTLKRIKAEDFYNLLNKELGKNTKDINSAFKNASLYEIFKIDGLQQKIDNLKEQINSMKEMTKDSFIDIPILGCIKAGEPAFAEQNIEGYFPTDKTLISNGCQYFYLKIKGDSMDKEFQENTLVLVKKQDYIENNEIGVVLIDDMDATVKKIVVNDNIITLIPCSNNNEYFAKSYDMGKGEVRILGKVVLAVKKY